MAEEVAAADDAPVAAAAVVGAVVEAAAAVEAVGAVWPRRASSWPAAAGSGSCWPRFEQYYRS